MQVHRFRNHVEIPIWEGESDCILVNNEGAITLMIDRGAILYGCGFADLMKALEAAKEIALQEYKPVHPHLNLWECSSEATDDEAPE